MTFLKRVANGLGTVLGAIAETVQEVVASVRSSYNAFRNASGPSEPSVEDEADRTRERLREVNEQIIRLRNERMSKGHLSSSQSAKWQDLRAERDKLLGKLNLAKEVDAAEKIIAAEESLENVEVTEETRHILEYNAFADVLNKKCKCGRPMKLQWKPSERRSVFDFFWGCTGWYFIQGGKRVCERTAKLSQAELHLMVDSTPTELAMTQEDLSTILTSDRVKSTVRSRMGDLKSELKASERGVEIATCPVHGENMVLREKREPSGLLDTYFLACPYWTHQGDGCQFIEKLKSGAQLAALLRSETGVGIL